MRWSTDLVSPALLADGGGFRLSDAQGRSAVVRLNLNRSWMEINCRASGLASPIRPNHPEWYYRRHLVVQLNPGHDHATQWDFVLCDDGKVISSAKWFVPGEEPADEFAVELPPPPKAVGRFRQIDERRFEMKLRLPAAGIWPEGGQVAGIAIKIGFHEECTPEPLCWPQPSLELRGPLLFGDLYRQKPAVQMDRVSIAKPAWGSTNQLNIEGRVSGKAKKLLALVRIILPGEKDQILPELSFPAKRKWSVNLPVVFPHRAKWASNAKDIARLSLVLADESGRQVWQGEYPFGFDAGIIIREKFGCPANRRPARPDPKDPCFVEKFRNYVLARIPDYRMRGPAGWFLEDPAGKADMDLRREDWPVRLAKMLADRFGRWDDALCSASMWAYHPLVTRHSPCWSRLAGQVPANAIPRLGGCFCDATGRLVAMLADRIGEVMGVKLTGYTMGLRGHILTMVESPIGQVVGDGMLGLWFHTLDNSRLATLSEMRQDRRIVERMWWYPRAHGHEFFSGNHKQIIRHWTDGPLEWAYNARPRRGEEE